MQMIDQFRSFTEIQKQFRENRDYRIETAQRGSSILILTPHGGGIERGTSELVRAIADHSFSYYIFEGVMSLARDSQKMHLTSTRFDEPRLLAMIHTFQTALAIHGCVGAEQVIYIGGKDTGLGARLSAILRRKGYDVGPENEQYSGTAAANICNRTATGMGVQIELTQAFRSQLFARWETREGRKVTTPFFKKFVSDIREILT
jgi:phage replication-related protein YjqB (UPF0714/DUF867 family)